MLTTPCHVCHHGAGNERLQAREMAPKLTEFEGTDNEILQILKPLWILSQLALRHDWANVDHAMLSQRKLCGNYKRNSLANDNAPSPRVAQIQRRTNNRRPHFVLSPLTVLEIYNMGCHACT